MTQAHHSFRPAGLRRSRSRSASTASSELPGGTGRVEQSAARAESVRGRPVARPGRRSGSQTDWARQIPSDAASGAQPEVQTYRSGGVSPRPERCSPVGQRRARRSAPRARGAMPCTGAASGGRRGPRCQGNRPDGTSRERAGCPKLQGIRRASGRPYPRPRLCMRASSACGEIESPAASTSDSPRHSLLPGRRSARVASRSRRPRVLPPAGRQATAATSEATRRAPRLESR